MNKFWTGSELAMNKFLFKLVKQIELLNLFNRGPNRLSSALDLTDFGWLVGGGWQVGVLDGIKAILSQLVLGLGLSLATSWGWGWTGPSSVPTGIGFNFNLLKYSLILTWKWWTSVLICVELAIWKWAWLKCAPWSKGLQCHLKHLW